MLKEDFRFFWDYGSPYRAGQFLDRLCTRTMRSQIEPMKKMARTLRAHRRLLLNWFRAKGAVSAASVEGFNNKAKLILRKSHGFRTRRAMEIALYHALGALPEPRVTQTMRKNGSDRYNRPAVSPAATDTDNKNKEAVMSNPFKKIAAALLLRGAVFAILGLILLAQAVPSLLDAGRALNVSGALIGALLLTVGVVDLVQGMQRVTRMRKSKLETPPIDCAYGRGGGGTAIPRNLMNADENPNEDGQATLVEWLTRVFPKLAYLPLPYTSVLHSVLIAFGLGAAGLLIYVALRVVMAGTSSPQQLTNILAWYLWLYFLIGLGFWAAVSRFGFRRALAFQNQLLPRKIVALFLALLFISVALAIAMTRTGTQVVPPPDLGGIVPILWGGSLVVIGAAVAIIMLRSKRAPDRYSAHRGEEFLTVGMHPTDMVNVIKSFTGNLGPGAFMYLGSWKPVFKEHTAVQAGEFEADLNAESTIQLNERANASIEAHLGTAIAWAGILTIAIAEFMLWNLAGSTWDSASAALLSLRTPIALTIFGSLVYRLGVIPVAELQWTSVLTACRIEGTFQAQGGMALMNAGEQTLKGSVLTSASVQPKCAYLTSVGFLQPGLARNTVVRLIDRVEPAGQIANDLLAAIRQQATHMMSAGAPAALRHATLHALPAQSHKEAGKDDDRLEASDPA